MILICKLRFVFTILNRHASGVLRGCRAGVWYVIVVV